MWLLLLSSSFESYYDANFNSVRFFFFFFSAAPAAYGGSQARGQIRTVACQPTPQPQKHQIRASSATTPQLIGNPRSLTH